MSNPPPPTHVTNASTGGAPCSASCASTSSTRDAWPAHVVSPSKGWTSPRPVSSASASAAAFASSQTPPSTRTSAPYLRRAAGSRRNIHVAAAALLVSAESPRRGRGVTRLRGISASRPRRYSSPRDLRVAAAASPRLVSTENVHVVAAASPRLVSANYRRSRGVAATRLRGLSSQPRRRRDSSPRTICGRGDPSISARRKCSLSSLAFTEAGVVVGSTTVHATPNARAACAVARPAP